MLLRLQTVFENTIKMSNILELGPRGGGGGAKRLVVGFTMHIGA